MTIAELCMLGMVFVVLGAVGPSKVLGRAEYDNSRPRDVAFLTTGFRQRSLWAHQNSYEALPFFLAAVVIAEMRGVPQGTINTMAAGYLLARILYVVCYWADRPVTGVDRGVLPQYRDLRFTRLGALKAGMAKRHPRPVAAITGPETPAARRPGVARGSGKYPDRPAPGPFQAGGQPYTAAGSAEPDR